MKKTALPVVALVVFSAGLGQASELPRAISPGQVQGVSRVEGRCPTFNWTAVSQATDYEVAVYSVDRDRGRTRLVLRQRIGGNATGWTPSLEDCFVSGERYAWTVRALTDGSLTSWAQPSLFEIVAPSNPIGLEQALAVVRAHLRTTAGDAPVASNAGSDPPPDPRGDAQRPAVPTGAGTGKPGLELSVSGDVEIGGEYRFAGPRVFVQDIPAAAFEPVYFAHDTFEFNGFARGPSNTSPKSAVASVHLPGGSDVTQVECYYYDNSAAGDFDYVRLELYARPLTGTGANVLASAQDNPGVSTSPDIRAFADTSVSGPGDPVDSSHSYVLGVILDLTNTSIPSPDLLFYGCQISYALDQLSH